MFKTHAGVPIGTQVLAWAAFAAAEDAREREVRPNRPPRPPTERGIEQSPAARGARRRRASRRAGSATRGDGAHDVEHVLDVVSPGPVRQDGQPDHDLPVEVGGGQADEPVRVDPGQRSIL
jgi:hypothetical protein